MSLRYCYRCHAPHPQGERCPRSASITSRGSTRQWRRTRAAILERDQHACQLCGAPATDIHHRTERILGGTDHPTNLQALCSTCHRDLV